MNLGALTFDSVSLIRSSLAHDAPQMGHDFAMVAVDIALFWIPFSGAGGDAIRAGGALTLASNVKGSGIAAAAWQSIRGVIGVAKTANIESSGSSSGGGSGGGKSKGPGRWVTIKESMSAHARAYQAKRTGRSENEVYLVNGVKFDGWKSGTLIDAKSKGWGNFINGRGEFYEWFGGREDLISQARRQIEAAGSYAIRWEAETPQVATAIKKTLGDAGIGGRIEVVVAP